MSERIIYLDNAATTRVAPEVAAVVEACMRGDYGNASSAHRLGIAAEKRVATARATLLGAIGDEGAEAGDLYWTAGGTESDALGVLGPARARARRCHNVVYSAIEHPAVSASAKLLEKEGWQAASVPVTPQGVVEVESVLDAIDEQTAVVAIMLVNNEIGTMMPIGEISRAVHQRRADIHVHCDAVQGLGKIEIDVAELGVDSLAFAGHKLHGPKGVGALWLRRGAPLVPLWDGGGQQNGVRSGTLNVPGIAGMGEAVRLAAAELDARQERWDEMAQTLLQATLDCGVEVHHNGGLAPRAPHVLSLGFKGVPAEPLLHTLEGRGIMVSAGSACSERSRKPSPVLTAIGLGEEFGTLRFSFGAETTLEEVEDAAGALVEAVRELRV